MNRITVNGETSLVKEGGTGEEIKAEGSVQTGKSNSQDSVYLEALREIEMHIRATSDPVPYIIKTLKEVLPEWGKGGRLS